MNGWSLSVGYPEPLGVISDPAGANFAVFSAHAEAIAVCIFDATDVEIGRFELPGRTGDVFHGHISGLKPGTRYGLRAYGAWDPEHGHRFNPNKLLVDPFATELDRPFRLHPDLCDVDGPRSTDTSSLIPKAIFSPPTECCSGDKEARTGSFDWNRQIIYELHVRGMTASNREIPESQRGTYAGLAHPTVIAHLRNLGVTAIELMPSAAWIDDRHLPDLGVSNYWGYNPIAFLAPDRRLAPGGWDEIRSAIRALQVAGFAVLLDVVINHTGEGDHLGPTVSFRGLDNATYYRTRADRFVDDAGCGNVLALDRPPVLRLAMEALRTWAVRGGLDGFRLDLATALGRRAEGFDPSAPLLAAIQQDPVLSRRVFIAEPWDIGAGGYQLGAFPGSWGEWNDQFRNTVRRFWRGDRGMLADLATRFAGSADVFAGRHRPLSRSINFVTAHDGFTLADLVAYAAKHNETNGEGNRDGADENYSWNNGYEGPTDDQGIQAARARDVRALLCTLLLARGTPMLSMGDEAGRSQNGNNNAYTQDNSISWFDWDNLNRALIAFTSRLVHIRHDCPVLSNGNVLTGRSIDQSMIPDVVWYGLDGRKFAQEDWRQEDRRSLVVALYAAGHRIVVVLHGDDLEMEAVVPEPRPGMRWACLVDSANPERTGPIADLLPVAPRSVVLLTEEAGAAPRRRSSVSSEGLDKLAQAAGIAPTWWDIEGRQHLVSDDTKRALLTGMKLPAGTVDEWRESSNRLAARADRLLPWSSVMHENEVRVLPFRGAISRSRQVVIQHEDGEVQTITVLQGANEIALPPLPSGRHDLYLEDDREAGCKLVVAPRRCYLPRELIGRRYFGIATQLYSLRRSGDQGIGDFTTLGHMVERGAACGAAAIGLNPLHALFPGAREQASPYFPSDRRFLDPIYIDVDGLPGADALSALDTQLIDYPAVWLAKERVLRAQFLATAGDDTEFESFIKREGVALHRFATFEAIAAEVGNTQWITWPPDLRHPLDPGVRRFAAAHAEAIRFAAWLQYRADQQLGRAAARHGLTVGLYRDLAVGSAPDGAESWSRQDLLLRDVSVGAPPDPFSEHGQNWGLPAPDPLAMTAEGYAGFAELLSANMRYAGALRIDHAMGLQRLFLVPQGAPAKDGAYLGYPFDDLLGVLALESHRARCLVVGEALGTVPQNMREVLAAADVLSYNVLWFERDGPRFRSPESWQHRAVACVSTHDLPTLSGWWQGADINERQRLGILDDAEAAAAWNGRTTDKTELLNRLREAGLLSESIDPSGLPTEALFVAVHAFVAATPSLLALVQADDLAGELIGTNLPGTDKERPNWRRRMTMDVDLLCRSRLAESVLTAMREGGRT